MVQLKSMGPRIHAFEMSILIDPIVKSILLVETNFISLDSAKNMF